MSECKFAEVCLENTAYSFDKKYTYKLPDNESASILPGCRVCVPFGRSNLSKQGLILNVFSGEARNDIKTVIRVLDTEPIVSKEMLFLIDWMKENTFCCYYDAVKCILPPGLYYRIKETYIGNPDVDTVNFTPLALSVYRSFLKYTKYVSAEAVFGKLRIEYNKKIIDELCAAGALIKNVELTKRINNLTVKFCRLTDEGYNSTNSSLKLSEKQKSVIKFLSDCESASVKEVCYFTGVSISVVNTLCNRGILEIFDNIVSQNSSKSDVSDAVPLTLNDEQLKAYESLYSQYLNMDNNESLLFGVTGSGKTQVYLKLIDSVISDGRQVIVLVPEISLTPQTLNIFTSRYGRKVAAIHSALSVRERTDEWKKIYNNEVDIVIGTRSAVFAPLKKIGLIIIDEEQEHTYKSEQSPRYNAKDVALFRAKYNKALLLLCSATPSIETYTKAKLNQISLNVLNKRFSGSDLPNVEIVDMYTEPLSDSQIFSKKLFDELYNCYNDKKQSVILLNRRGYNTYAKCNDCGRVISCPFCSISLTYHYSNNRLMCHYCGYSQESLQLCPNCNGTDISLSGYGTQKVESELSALIPGIRILRMDADTTFSKNSYNNMLSDFCIGKYDVLIGTQMVAKGHNFPKVTVVGVLNADCELNNDDFRSQEKSFSLLTQVIGRSGRGEFKGKAVIQTNNPLNEVISFASKQDYDGFYRSEVQLRKILIYPPFCNIFLVGFSSSSENKSKNAAEAFFITLKNLLSDEYTSVKAIVLGPSPARVIKVNNKYRYRIILKGKNNRLFREFLRKSIEIYNLDKRFSGVSVFIDINPENIV